MIISVEITDQEGGPWQELSLLPYELGTLLHTGQFRETKIYAIRIPQIRLSCDFVLREHNLNPWRTM